MEWRLEPKQPSRLLKKYPTQICKLCDEVCDQVCNNICDIANICKDICDIFCDIANICKDICKDICDIANICKDICDVRCPFRATIVLQLLRRRFDKISLVLFGLGSGRMHHERLAASPRLEKKTYFVGFTFWLIVFISKNSKRLTYRVWSS